MSELGLPDVISKSSSKRSKSYSEYKLVKELVLPEFFETFKESDLTFLMAEPSSAQMEQAGKLAGQNSILMAKELLFRSIGFIGDWATAGTRDASLETGIDAWWDLIGIKNRDLITSEFTTMMSPSEEEVTTFRSSKRIVTK